MSPNVCDVFAFGMCICMGIVNHDLFVIHVLKEQLWLSVLLKDAHRLSAVIGVSTQSLLAGSQIP